MSHEQSVILRAYKIFVFTVTENIPSFVRPGNQDLISPCFFSLIVLYFTPENKNLASFWISSLENSARFLSPELKEILNLETKNPIYKPLTD